MVHGRNRSSMEAFKKDFFDVVNIGCAMPVPDRVGQCMREGGVLLIPEPACEKRASAECDGDEKQAKQKEEAECKSDARFAVYKKINGELQGPLEKFCVKFVLNRQLPVIEPAHT